MENKTLRYAVIGAGGIALTHLRDIGGQPGVSIVGLADPADPKAWRVPADYAAVPRFQDAEKMLRATKPDLVSICTPNKFHHPLALLALQLGAHVVCEKPLAMTVAEAEEMEAARAAADKLGGINFSYRNVAAFRFARELIAGGELGRLLRVNCVYLQSFLGAPATPHSWRNDIRLAGFGALGDLGVHMIDGVRFVSGLGYRRVVGLAQTLIPEKPDAGGTPRPVTTDTNAAFLAELDGGVIATFETTQVAPGYGNFFRIEISGERGTIAVHSDHPEELWLRAGAALTQYATWKTDVPLQKLPTDFIGRGGPTTPGAIVHAIRGEQVEFPTFADGLLTQRVLGAILASMKSGAWEKIA
ncbi:MAG: Gfo/Idh/MocA family oxidoreductase [Opitutaceae bacterium]|nr:Gfo/Idh/MocA family oxidoreductase [Opitutaceae bacterium]MBP9913109.1 Gfo/Idh/MocA family oxidoreductase [Opitutaceae bacterium]